MFKAPVVQWIERLTPNEQIQVRFLVGAQARTWCPAYRRGSRHICSLEKANVFI